MFKEIISEVIILARQNYALKCHEIGIRPSIKNTSGYANYMTDLAIYYYKKNKNTTISGMKIAIKEMIHKLHLDSQQKKILFQALMDSLKKKIEHFVATPKPILKIDAELQQERKTILKKEEIEKDRIERNSLPHEEIKTARQYYSFVNTPLEIRGRMSSLKRLHEQKIEEERLLREKALNVANKYLYSVEKPVTSIVPLKIDLPGSVNNAEQESPIENKIASPTVTISPSTTNQSPNLFAGRQASVEVPKKRYYAF